MPHFTKAFETEQGFYNFYFNRIYTAEGTCYHVSTIGKDRKSVMFTMREKEGQWLIANKDNCPDWLLNIELKISSAILDHKLLESKG